MSTRVETIRARVGKTPVKLLVEYDNETGHPIDVVTAGHGKIGTQLDCLWRCFVLAWRINWSPGRVQLGPKEFAWTDKPRVPLSAILTFVGRADETAGATGNERVPRAGGHADFFGRALLAYAESPQVAEFVAAISDAADVEPEQIPGAAGMAGGVGSE